MTRFPTGAMSVVKSTILVHAMVLNGSRVCGEDIPIYDTVPFGADGRSPMGAVSVVNSNTPMDDTVSNGSHIDEQPRLPLGTVACTGIFVFTTGPAPNGDRVSIAILYDTTDAAPIGDQLRTHLSV